MGCQGLHMAIHRVGTNGMTQPSPRMEIQKIKFEFITFKTLKSQLWINPKFHETMDQSKILFDEAPRN
jgi:hypothetical protein